MQRESVHAAFARKQARTNVTWRRLSFFTLQNSLARSLTRSPAISYTSCNDYFSSAAESFSGYHRSLFSPRTKRLNIFFNATSGVKILIAIVL